MYKTESYLGDLLASIERQSPGNYQLEVIFVDDGSPDASSAIAADWLARTGQRGSVITQENGGVSRARNAGIAAATGTWVGFPDSDDLFADDFLRCIASALDVHSAEAPVLIATNIARYHDADGRIVREHPLKAKFRNGTTVVDLDRRPEFIQSQVTSALFLRSAVMDTGTRFISDLHVAEDALFVAELLLKHESRRVLLAAEAEFLYRQRSAGDSAVDTFSSNPDYYFGRFSRGYLPLLQSAADGVGVPRWLGNLVLYDLRWYLSREMWIGTRSSHLSDEERAGALELVRRTVAYIERDWIVNYNVTWLGAEIRNVLVAMRDEPIPSGGIVRLARTSRQSQQFELRYLFAGDVPTEVVSISGDRCEPIAAKTRTLDYLGQRYLRERILIVPASDQVTIELNGVRQAVIKGPYRIDPSELNRSWTSIEPPVTPPRLPHPRDVDRGILRRMAGRLRREAASWFPKAFRGSPASEPGWKLREARHEKLVQVLAQRPESHAKYAASWIFLDRIGAAGDNAEYLYRRIREVRPEINAWFVIRRGTADWTRLSHLGFRLIPYGSREHKIALLHAEAVLSSHLDVEVIDQVPLRYYWNRSRQWKFIYLQHGVLQHDLALWFNSKPIDLLTSASFDEHRSIVEDDSSYTLTENSVRLTGFPRHDEIVRRTGAIDPSQRRLLLVAPTWRESLMAPKTAFGESRRLLAPLEQTTFGANWLGLLNDPRLLAISQQHELEIVFLPHPSLREFVDATALPSHVKLIAGTVDTLDLLCRSQIVVTDYSSIFFDAAIAGARVAYFQFDRDEYLGGGHTYVRGYWSYEEHGFGPIAMTIDALVESLETLAGDEATTKVGMYQARVKRTLPMVDGRSADRIIESAESVVRGNLAISRS